MARSHLTTYDFFCEDCKHEFRDMMWTNDDEPDGVNCPKCEVLLMPEVKKTASSAMINTREDWVKKLPGGWTDFLGSFEKRHSKYSRTMNSHKRGNSS